MGRHVAGDAPAMDRLVEESIVKIGSEIAALAVPRLRGVVLGGGYGRGEGGVFVGQDGSERLYNDLDFYVVAEDGSSEADIDAIGEKLAPISRKWTERLSVDVDFCRAKTPWRIHHDQERVMIQELLHGYFDVAGLRGEELFAGVEKREPSAFPWTESVRLLMNRGVGLLLAAEPRQSETFVVRNVNKCVLGAGDALLIAEGRYRWKAAERAEALADPLYSKALEWKFRPSEKGVCDWNDARVAWLAAVEKVDAIGRTSGAVRRSIYQAARWIARRRTVGDLATLGYEPVVRILCRLVELVRDRRPIPGSLRRDWEIFN